MLHPPHKQIWFWIYRHFLLTKTLSNTGLQVVRSLLLLFELPIFSVPYKFLPNFNFFRNEDGEPLSSDGEDELVYSKTFERVTTFINFVFCFLLSLFFLFFFNWPSCPPSLNSNELTRWGELPPRWVAQPRLMHVHITHPRHDYSGCVSDHINMPQAGFEPGSRRAFPFEREHATP